MDLAITEDQEMLRSLTKDFVAKQAPLRQLIALRKAGPVWDERWAPTLTSTGWGSLAVPEEFGGTDAQVLESVLVLEGLGAGPVQGPLFETSLLGAELLRHSPDSSLRATLLAGIGSGEVRLAVAWQEAGRSWPQVSSCGLGETNTLSTRRLFVPFADLATNFLVPVQVSGSTAVFAVVPADRPGISYRLLPGFGGWQHEVVFDEVSVAPDELLTVGRADSRTLQGALAKPLLALAGFQLGGMETVLAMSIEHSRTRVQFGQPIGRFQRVQDHIVRIVNALDAARWATYFSASQLDAGREDLASVHVAAAIASESYRTATDAAHEVLAGVGSDPELGLTLFTEMSRSTYSYLGHPNWHRDQLAAVLFPKGS